MAQFVALTVYNIIIISGFLIRSCGAVRCPVTKYYDEIWAELG